MRNVHRADYQQVLYEAAVERGVTIRLGCPVVSVDEATASVTLKSGEVIRADLIVGADGRSPTVQVVPALISSRHEIHRTRCHQHRI